MKKIVIVGAGFAGIMAAKQLTGLENVHLTIISDRDHFLFTPRLTELLNESVDEKIVVKKLSEIFEGKGLLLQEKAISVDLKKKKLKTEKREVDYDYLILAPGSVTNYFGNERLRQNTIDYKDYAAMVRIKHKMREVIKQASEQNKQMHFVVVGGGFTGVELICSLREAVLREMAKYSMAKESAKFILVQGGQTIMPALEEKPRAVVEQYLKNHGIEVRTNTVVEDITGTTLTTKNNEKLEGDLIAWTAGIVASNIEFSETISKERGNCIPVTPTGQMALHDDVYVIGDIGLCNEDGKLLPPTAQVAFQEGVRVGKNLRSRILGNAQKPFKYRHLGTLIVLGHDFGMLTRGSITLKGKLGWYFRDLAYRFRFWQLT